MKQSSSYFERFLIPLDDPSSRLFYWNILASLLFVLLYVIFTSKKNWGLKLSEVLFRKNYWWNSSAKVDYSIYLFNGLLKAFLALPVIEGSYVISRWTIKSLIWSLGDTGWFELTVPAALLFTVAAFLWDDGLRYVHHYLSHKIPFLWAFHKVHHSARVVTPITLYRTHPVEVFTATFRNALSLGVSIGVFIYLFERTYSVYTFMGVNGIAFSVNLLGSHLRHSQVPFSFGPLEHVLISPKQHQIHHSSRREHFDKNFGVSLSIWDRMMGTLVFSKEVTKPLRFGVGGLYRQNLRTMLLQPLKESYRSLVPQKLLVRNKRAKS